MFGLVFIYHHLCACLQNVNGGWSAAVCIDRQDSQGTRQTRASEWKRSWFDARSCSAVDTALPLPAIFRRGLFCHVAPPTPGPAAEWRTCCDNREADNTVSIQTKSAVCKCHLNPPMSWLTQSTRLLSLCPKPTSSSLPCPSAHPSPPPPPRPLLCRHQLLPSPRTHL